MSDEKLRSQATMICDAFLKMPKLVQDMFFEELLALSSNNSKFFNLIHFELYADECESPIETIYFRTLDVMSFAYLMPIVITPQYEIECGSKTYRADFIVDYYYKDDTDDYVEVIVECDGHDFHEKTKKQVAYNNKRDMDLKMEGYDILHFSGSQIYNDPQACAKATLDYLKKKGETNERC